MLKNLISESKLTSFQTGIKYQSFHALSILILIFESVSEFLFLSLFSSSSKLGGFMKIVNVCSLNFLLILLI